MADPLQKDCGVSREGRPTGTCGHELHPGSLHRLHGAMWRIFYKCSKSGEGKFLFIGAHTWKEHFSLFVEGKLLATFLYQRQTGATAVIIHELHHFSEACDGGSANLQPAVLFRGQFMFSGGMERVCRGSLINECNNALTP